MSENKGVYLLFIHRDGFLEYGGYFSTRDKAEAVKVAWNNLYENEHQFADWINVTHEVDNEFILGLGEYYWGLSVRG